MKKISNNDIIYVFESSVLKLTERNFAYQDITTICNPIDENCNIKLDDDYQVCIFTIDSCIETYDLPISENECKNMFKLYSILAIVPPLEVYGTVKNYSEFSYVFCGILQDYHNLKVDQQIKDYKTFTYKKGIPNTIKFNISSTNDSSPRELFGDGSFSSKDFHYKFIYQSKGGKIGNFVITNET